jgi:hypothetical protein
VLFLVGCLVGSRSCSIESGSWIRIRSHRSALFILLFNILHYTAGETGDARGAVPPHWFLIQVRGCPQEAGGRGAETPRLLARDHEGQ